MATATTQKDTSRYSTSNSVYEDASWNKDANMQVLREDDPIQGQKFFCMSLISPESRQKNAVSALKIRGSFDTEDEARRMANHLRNYDPVFDVYVGPVGKWLPLVFSADDVPDQEYLDSRLTQLISGQKEQRELASNAFDERVHRDMEEIRRLNTEAGRAERLAEKEKPVSVYYKILQLKEVIAARQEELDKWEAVFASETYSDEERQQAREHPYPKVRVAPSAFQHVDDDKDTVNKADEPQKRKPVKRGFFRQ